MIIYNWKNEITLVCPVAVKFASRLLNDLIISVTRMTLYFKYNERLMKDHVQYHVVKYSDDVSNAFLKQRLFFCFLKLLTSRLGLYSINIVTYCRTSLFLPCWFYIWTFIHVSIKTSRIGWMKFIYLLAGGIVVSCIDLLFWIELW